jgi:hypothetical protein
MDVVRAFEASGLAAGGVAINIQGTVDKPYFQANQVGELLGLVNIRSTLKDFDEDEVCEGISKKGRFVTYLTELGLHRVIGMSRKPYARLFHKWVVKTTLEMHLQSKEELKASLKAVEAELEDANEALERLSAINVLVPQVDSVSIAKDALKPNSDKHTIGNTIDDEEPDVADGMSIVYVRKTSNGALVQDIAKYVLRRYNHEQEDYCCRVEHTVDVYDIACVVVDTLASSREFMKRGDLFRRIIAELQAIQDGAAPVDP